MNQGHRAVTGFLTMVLSLGVLSFRIMWDTNITYTILLPYLKMWLAKKDPLTPFAKFSERNHF